MVVSGTSFDPTRPPPAVGPLVDYALAKRAVLASIRRGSMGVTDVCDAHPELLRAAKHIGEGLDAPCPICSHDTLVSVRYVYGDELRRNNGRVVYPMEWLSELARNHEQFTCYVVEVCTDCAWNHLTRSYMAGRKFGLERARSERREPS